MNFEFSNQHTNRPGNLVSRDIYIYDWDKKTWLFFWGLKNRLFYNTSHVIFYNYKTVPIYCYVM